MIAQPKPADTEPGTTFRLYLKAQRTMRGWSQGRLAKESGIHHSHISRLEGGLRQPTDASITLLAGGLRLNPMQRDRLRMDAGLAPLDPASAIAIKPLQELYQALRDQHIHGQVREAILTAVDALAQIADNAAGES